MSRTTFFLLCLTFTGCTEAPFDFLEGLSGTKTNTVILAADPILLGPQQVEFPTKGETLVLGDNVSVCASLRGDFPIGPREVMDNELDRLLGGAELTAKITDEAGNSFEFSGAWQSWSKFGVVLENEELAACARLSCSDFNLEVGTKIFSIAISTNKALSVKGLYWQSSNK